jgi:hypothetical protein
MSDALWIAFALILVIEGIGPMLFTRRWRNYIAQIATMPLQQLRSIGGVMVTLGLVSLFFLV